VSKRWIALLVAVPVLVVAIATAFILRSASRPMASDAGNADVQANQAGLPASMPPPARPPGAISSTPAAAQKSDASADELARMRTENAALRAEINRLGEKQTSSSIKSTAPAGVVQTQPILGALKSPAPIVPATLPASFTGSISGSSWISKDGVSSDIQRGLTISVIRGTATKAAVVQCLDVEIDYRLDSAKQNDATAADLRKNAGPDFDPGKEYADDAARDRQVAADIRRAITQLPAQMGVNEAHKVIAFYAYNFRSNFDAVVASSLVKRERTDADGKYTIDGISEGDYFLYAEIHTPSLFVDWVVPVHVAAGTTVKVDLFNDNAAVINKADPDPNR